MPAEPWLIPVVEVLSVLILGAFVLAQPGAQRRKMAWDAWWIGAGAVLGEETCIAWYRFYDYAPGWSLKVIHVPVMVGCIWPAVVLSARQVAGLLAVTPTRRTLGVAGLVFFDATLVEAVSVASGLWTWEEGAVFGVPIIGLVGWAAYSAWAALAVDRNAPWLARLLVPAALTHVVLLTTWWGGLRWGLRAPLPATVLWTVSTLGALALAWHWWPKRGRVPLAIMGPRALAALLFFGLVARAAQGAQDLVWFTLPFALPYILVTAWRRSPLT